LQAEENHGTFQKGPQVCSTGIAANLLHIVWVTSQYVAILIASL
jgi:hypothetical protein